MAEQLDSFDIDGLKQLLLDTAQERAAEGVLKLVVERLARQPPVALCRIWLVKPGDICTSCRMRPECPDQSVCLHLVAGAGESLTGQQLARLDGSFRRFPMGIRKVGRIAASGQPVEVADIREGGRWIADPDWVAKESIRGFGGQPLIYKGEVLGVLAVFSRAPMTPDFLIWLRMIADHAAVAIANGRAFEEIERLRGELELENEYLREEIKSSHGFGEIIGESAALKKVLTQVELVAPADASVLICGESGSGKELIARAIHERSRRADRPLIQVNCASTPRELFESEFFGHVKGSFTGAIRDRIGRFQLADGGTLFLDEIGEIPLELQSKLLRVLQEGTFERIGDEKTRRVDVRVVAATNRDLKQEIAAGRFREDLYYRLGVFPIDVAPLRERRDDVPLLAARFLDDACRRLGVPLPKLRRRHIEELQRYDWPGNVRELQNVVERAAIRARSAPLGFDLTTASAAAAPEEPPAASERLLTYAQLRELERRNVEAALTAAHWKISGPGGAAALLGTKPTTLASKIKALGLRD